MFFILAGPAKATLGWTFIFGRSREILRALKIGSSCFCSWSGRFSRIFENWSHWYIYLVSLKHWRRAPTMCFQLVWFLPCYNLPCGNGGWKLVGLVLNGFDLSDRVPHLIVVQYADDIFLFSERTVMEVRKLLDNLVAELSEVRLLLNAEKDMFSTSQSQPPSTITTDHGITLRVLSGDVAQRWCGCMLTAHGSEQRFLEARTAPISQRLRYFDAGFEMNVLSVACVTIFLERMQTLEWLRRGAFLNIKDGIPKFPYLIRNDPTDINDFGGMRLEINREFFHVQNNSTIVVFKIYF